MLSEKEIEILLENGLLIKSKSSILPDYLIETYNGLGIYHYYFMDAEKNYYYLKEEVNKLLEKKIFKLFSNYLEDKRRLLEKAIKIKTYLVFPSEGSKLKILKDEHEKNLLEMNKNFSQQEIANLDADFLFWKCKSTHLNSSLDKLLKFHLINQKVGLSFINNIIHLENFPEMERDLYLMEFCYNSAWILQQMDVENSLKNLEIEKLNRVNNLNKPENDNEDERNELIAKGYKPPTENTILTVAQTALLIDYLQESKLLFTNHLGKSKTSKIVALLTKHSNNTLRQNLDINKLVEIKNHSSNGSKETFGNLKKLKEVLQDIVSSIDKEIEEKEKL